MNDVVVLSVISVAPSSESPRSAISESIGAVITAKKKLEMVGGLITLSVPTNVAHIMTN